MRFRIGQISDHFVAPSAINNEPLKVVVKVKYPHGIAPGTLTRAGSLRGSCSSQSKHYFHVDAERLGI
jgi:hypothetical protein